MIVTTGARLLYTGGEFDPVYEVEKRVLKKEYNILFWRYAYYPTKADRLKSWRGEACSLMSCSILNCSQKRRIIK